MRIRLFGRPNAIFGEGELQLVDPIPVILRKGKVGLLVLQGAGRLAVIDTGNMVSVQYIALVDADKIFR